MKHTPVELAAHGCLNGGIVASEGVMDLFQLVNTTYISCLQAAVKTKVKTHK